MNLHIEYIIYTVFRIVKKLHNQKLEVFISTIDFQQQSFGEAIKQN